MIQFTKIHFCALGISLALTILLAILVFTQTWTPDWMCEKEEDGSVKMKDDKKVLNLLIVLPVHVALLIVLYIAFFYLCKMLMKPKLMPLPPPPVMRLARTSPIYRGSPVRTPRYPYMGHYSPRKFPMSPPRRGMSPLRSPLRSPRRSPRSHSPSPLNKRFSPLRSPRRSLYRSPRSRSPRRSLYHSPSPHSPSHRVLSRLQNSPIWGRLSPAQKVKLHSAIHKIKGY